MLKTQLDSSTKGFDTLVEAIDLMMRDQIREVRATMEMDRNTWSTDVAGALLFAEVRGIASKWCIDTLYETYRMVLDGHLPGEECNDPWWNIVYGMPCPHQIRRLILADTPIPPTDIHDFWKQLAWRVERQDDTVPIDPIDLTLRDFFRRYNEGLLGRETLLIMASAFSDATDPGSSTMRPPPNGERTGNSRRGGRARRTRWSLRGDENGTSGSSSAGGGAGGAAAGNRPHSSNLATMS